MLSPVEYEVVQSSVVLCISSSWGSWSGSTTRGMLSGGYHSNIKSSVVWDTGKQTISSLSFMPLYLSAGSNKKAQNSNIFSFSEWKLPKVSFINHHDDYPSEENYLFTRKERVVNKINSPQSICSSFAELNF